ncbi:SipW-dependent-type signal peptide-containing protein [Microbacterium algeriense]|uniref:SipW-dependent-type signal peptide-containing protein n=1 Tax=Microbacterium algeriense TaxID=2615184 RepID=UPI0002E32D34|nr:SipW-dependent-type signal peptide-containing protein [Microbacterium barkeri]
MVTKATQRKIGAVLAGGLVLGIGTAATLAAWNDSEFANGTFTAGAFNLEGSTDGTTYADHSTAGTAATLAFTLPAGLVSNMSPSSTVYAGFWVRLAAGTTSAANLTASGATADPAATSNSDHLSYAIYQLAPGATCNAASATGTPVASGATLDALTGATAIPLTAGAPATDPGTAVQLCFRVTADAALEPSLVTDATWSFTATSTN